MRVVRFHAPGDVRIEDADEPVAGPGELKLRVRNCSTCGTDVKIWRFGHHHIVPPRIMGHEIAGQVVDVGDGVSGFAPGDRVQVIAAIPCGRCRECRLGRMTVCPYQESIGYHYQGGFAEYLVVPAKVLAVGGVNQVPDSVGYAEASVAEPLACVLNGQELARVGRGDAVAVIGAGPIGCLHVRLARARGADRVFLADLNPDRLALAAAQVKPDAAVCTSEVDMVAAVRELTEGHGADVVITAAASGRAQEQAIAMAARQGRISFFGGLPKDDPVIACDANLVHYRELTIVGANGSSPAHNTEALRLIAEDAVPVSDLLTHRLDLERTLDAFEIVARGDAIKVTIEPWELAMPSRLVRVGSRSGLHARPAALFVAAAAAAVVPVTIRTGDKPPVPAASMLSVLALGATCGTEVVIEAEGAGADAALDDLAALLARDLDAEEPEAVNG